MIHSDMNGSPQKTYKMGDFIMFSMRVNSTTAVKGVIQKCWATPDGINNYNLIDNQWDSILYILIYSLFPLEEPCLKRNFKELNCLLEKLKFSSNRIDKKSWETQADVSKYLKNTKLSKKYWCQQNKLKLEKVIMLKYKIFCVKINKIISNYVNRFLSNFSKLRKKKSFFLPSN